MKNRYLILIIVSISLIAGCITQFIPETDESSDILVVEGIITDQDRTNRIKISKNVLITSLGQKLMLNMNRSVM